jgi:hypothetical protein
MNAPDSLRFSASLELGFWNLGFHSLPVNRRENQHQLLGFAIELARFVGQFRLGRGDHAEKKHRFLGFLDAATNRVAEILFRHTFIGLTVIRAHAGAGTNNLIDQTIVSRGASNSFREADDGFTEPGRPFFQIEWMTTACCGRLVL